MIYYAAKALIVHHKKKATLLVYQSRQLDCMCIIWLPNRTNRSICSRKRWGIRNHPLVGVLSQREFYTSDAA